MPRRFAGLLILCCLACSKDLSTMPEAQRWRAARTARLDEALALQKKQLPEMHKLPEKLATGYARVQKQLLMDAVADCVTMERVGTIGDGGKWLCNGYRIAPPCVVYGVGAAEEISFEEEMASKFGCEVHVFDPSPTSKRAFGALEKGKKLGKGSLTFHAWGLGPVSDDPAQAMKLVLEGQLCEVKTLSDMAKALGHAKIDVLKMDIEGGEYSVLKELLKDGALKQLQIKQVQIEFHGKDFDKLVNAIEALADAGFLMYRKELNPYDPEWCAEYAFADKTFLLD
jgi:FkbM family methyltransferase